MVQSLPNDLYSTNHTKLNTPVNLQLLYIVKKFQLKRQLFVPFFTTKIPSI